MSIEFTFKTVWKSDLDNWSLAGPIISESVNLAVVADALSAGKLLALEHRHYRGSRRPDMIVLSDFDDFVDYLKENAVAGDAIYIFDITPCLQEGNQLVHGKCPDDRGEVPRGGAY